MSDRSTYTPFFRRFTDEKAREGEAFATLYERVAAKHRGFTEDKVSIGRRVVSGLPPVPDGINSHVVQALLEVLSAERHFWELPHPHGVSLAEQVNAANQLHRTERFLDHLDRDLPLFEDALREMLRTFFLDLPGTEAPTPFTIPLIYALPNPREAVNRLMDIVFDPGLGERGLFVDLAEQLYRNLCAASGREPFEPSKKPFKYPWESALPPDALVRTYLAGTPFYGIATAPVPLKLSHEVRFSHMHVIGGTGAGKTTLLENLIHHDLTSDDPPSLVIIDPHRDLITKLTRADLGIDHRLVIIDPRDTDFPPALNVFALNRDRLAGYSEAAREQVTAGVIQTFDYLFSGLLGADLTAKQGVLFRYVARLMLALPEAMGRNATILDMLRLMADHTPYLPAIQTLPEIPRSFFEHDFKEGTFKQTREQIRYRLQAILENPTMARLFTSPETKVDLFEELNRGSVILVDTAKDFLKGASANFGRIFISLALQAVLERAALHGSERKPTFIMVDEAADYFDSNIDDLLTEARKYKCGLVLAHQYLDQASHALRASLAANTGIKFASGLSAADARAMAPEMRTTADFILDQPRLHFAAHVRNVTPHAVSIPIDTGVLDRAHRRTHADLDRLLAGNRARVSLAPALPGWTDTPVPDEGYEPPEDEETSREW